MYIQITSKCNMACEHCCMSCAPGKGKHMSMATFRKALQLNFERGDTIQLGGGEPTLHPDFWEILGLSLGHTSEDAGVWLATNGSMTETAIALARMARRGVIGCALSQDPWHRPIDPRVVEAFSEGHPMKGKSGWYPMSEIRSRDAREIRNVSVNEESMSPWRGDADNGGNEDECPCEDLFVDPNGRIWACGCRKLSFGTVDKPAIPDEWEWGMCYRKQPKKKCRAA